MGLNLNTNYRNITGIGLFVLLLGLLVYDILPATSDAEGDTISEVLADLPAAGILLAGYFLGHFWPIGTVLKRIWAKPEGEPAAPAKDDTPST